MTGHSTTYRPPRTPLRQSTWFPTYRMVTHGDAVRKRGVGFQSTPFGWGRRAAEKTGAKAKTSPKTDAMAGSAQTVVVSTKVVEKALARGRIEAQTGV
jgi:hypothetical protein